ncbi:hypothetical protein [Shimia abyssi]|uniref:Uncharacterized protein n=1 Tax=Shimia abyssi TaxID=1662395 RepID=A0A2P8F6L3_9RHOB|nr:hypothetical protein [Shimia abyssi]PSL17338.1 hypothetical protein CLV88_11813 [Shimia abyssi]
MPGFARLFVTITACAVALTACAPTHFSGFVNPGTNVDTVNRDTAECDVEANTLFPAAVFTSTSYGGGYGYSPGYWGGWGSTVTARDVNAGMRNNHRTQCMALRGYQPYSFPICTQEQLAGRSYAPLSKSPTPGPTICVVTSPNGNMLIDLSKPI